MSQTQAEIAIIEDHVRGREDFQDMAEDLKAEGREYSVNVPPSFDKMEQLFLFHNLDGLLIDVNLRLWDLSKRLIKRVAGVGRIRDGVDIANLAFSLFRRAKDAICIYSSEVNLEDPKWVQRIDSLPFRPTVISKYMNYEMAREVYFKVLLEKANKVRSANPMLQPPDFAKMAPNDRLHAFKSVYFNSANWVDCHFDTVGDYAWVVVCGHSVETNLYGSPLNGGRVRNFGVKTTDKYLDSKSLKAIAKMRNYFPFILWNARKPEFIEQQFRQAGPRLVNIPQTWRSFFGVAMARPCARAYVEDHERRALTWCQELDEIGKVEAAKVIYKRLLGKTSSHMSEFKRAAKQFELPQVVDILAGKVEEINEKESKAVVSLKSLPGGVPFNEVFDLKMLKQAKISFIAQRFDYTVYQQPRGDIGVNVEPLYDEGNDA